MKCMSLNLTLVSDGRAQILQAKQQLVYGAVRQEQLLEGGKLLQKQLELIKEELKTEQDNNRWLRTELEQKNRELLKRDARINEPRTLLADATRDMDASLQAIEKYLALAAKLANQRYQHNCFVARGMLGCADMRAYLAYYLAVGQNWESFATICQKRKMRNMLLTCFRLPK